VHLSSSHQMQKVCQSFLRILRRGYLPQPPGTRKGKEVRPPPHSRKEDFIDSDNELIGAFDDDDELELDECEDDVDQDLVVSSIVMHQTCEYGIHLHDRPLNGQRRLDLDHVCRHAKPHALNRK
jgi:hypothetical protein